MIAKDLISDAIVPLKTSDSGLDALTWMDEYRVSHLPIVNNTEFLGVISDTDIYNLNTPDESLGNHLLSLNRPFVTQEQHVYDVIKLIAELRLTMVPVLDNKNNYIGVITLNDLIDRFAEMASVKNPGGILVIEVNQNDYSLSEIARIVESNDAKILSTFITSFPDSTKMDVTIKINKIDIAGLLQTFNRYNYIIKASFSEGSYHDDLQDRYDSLMNFLNV
jgi:acetoin utilization protein AcuB